MSFKILFIHFFISGMVNMGILMLRQSLKVEYRVASKISQFGFHCRDVWGIAWLICVYVDTHVHNT